MLNHDDPILRSFKEEVNANIIWFSINERLDKGIYIDGEDIVINDGKNAWKFMKINEIKILGLHNLENILGCIGISLAMGIDKDILKRTIANFKGVEHRIEYVTERDGIKFYNDSKGTNPQASIKALQALPGPIILIAGGYDKGSNYDEMMTYIHDKVKGMILLGETKYKICESADKQGFRNYYIVDNLEEAVLAAYKLGLEGDNVLLSPACASWDMFKSFEERGNIFKNLVYRLGDD